MLLTLSPLGVGAGTLPAIEGVGDGEGCFSTMASSGAAITLFFVLVVMVAVELIPGRKASFVSSDRSFNSIVTLNSLASWTFTRLVKPPVVSDFAIARGFF